MKTTTKQTHPLLGPNWLEKLGITLKTGNSHQTVNYINKPDQTNGRPDADIKTPQSKFHKHFTKNHTVNIVDADIQLKEGTKLIQQKGGPILIHLQPAVKKVIGKLKKQ